MSLCLRRKRKRFFRVKMNFNRSPLCAKHARERELEEYPVAISSASPDFRQSLIELRYPEVAVFLFRVYVAFHCCDIHHRYPVTTARIKLNVKYMSKKKKKKKTRLVIRHSHSCRRQRNLWLIKARMMSGRKSNGTWIIRREIKNIIREKHRLASMT